jgi:hypothetical protein
MVSVKRLMSLTPKDIILLSSDYGCEYLRDNPFMPAGHNGPYEDPETPVRNNAHWAMIFIKGFELTERCQYLESAEKCLAYLKANITDKSPVFFCRDKTGKDHTNGLIGQAWAIEPFMAIQKFSSDQDLLEIGADVIKRHFFDQKKGLWKVCDQFGNPTVFDHTFNHQLWFAAVGSYYREHDPEIDAMIKLFLECINKNLVMRKNGRIGQAIFSSSLESIIKPGLKKIFRRDETHYMKMKEVGYHSFNTIAFVMLNINYPDHDFWRSKNFKSIMKYLNSSEYQSSIFLSKYGFPYNPPGFEVLATKLHFDSVAEVEEKFVSELWQSQIDRTWDKEEGLMSKGSFDEHTNAARAYECRLCC